MRENWIEPLVGAVVLLGAGLFLTYLLLAGDARPAPDGYGLTASFGQVGGLREGDEVRVAGVKVGRVERIALQPETYMAVAELEIAPQTRLPRDSTARVTSDGLLGGAYVAIEPGADTAMLKAGGEIENTQGAVDLFGLIGQFINKPATAGEPAT
ncbi:MAG: outer membrane lipid asymmetry maintenance protein MlaD [Caulobacter sp.]|jgi:phospholipid/cholesterol/gamma-HCH transport system substrate-binding protein|nr:outer membrane lipid asymmetry maintenance protein MlaD [Caulobacter sp.]